MSEAPVYKLNREPRFSAAQLASYMQTVRSKQRDQVIQQAKFPRNQPIIAYRRARDILPGIIANKAENATEADAELARLDTLRRNEPEGWSRDDLQREMNALEAFKEAAGKIRFGSYNFRSDPISANLRIEGVQVNVRINSPLTQTGRGGVTNSGGCLFVLQGGEQARKGIEGRLKIVAGLVHWGLEELGGNIEPLPRLCMAFDVFGKSVVKAPNANDRLRENMVRSCREAA